MLLDRKKLLAKDTLEILKVDLNEEEYVFVKQMTGRERDLFEQSLIKKVVDRAGKEVYEQTLVDFRAKLAVCTLCDEKGDLLLRPTDYELLSQNMGAVKLAKIVDVAQELNKVSEQSKEGLVKNSPAGLTGSSNSDSAES